MDMMEGPVNPHNAKMAKICLTAIFIIIGIITISEVLK